MRRGVRWFAAGLLLVCGAAAWWAGTAAGAKRRSRAAEQAPKARLGPWYRIGPFRAKGGEGFARSFPPEERVELDKPCGEMRWGRVEDADGRAHSLAAPQGPDEQVYYLYRKITAPAAETLEVRVGCDDGLVVWCNGRKLAENRESFRTWQQGSDAVSLPLRKGDNDLLVKVWNMRGRCGYYFAAGPGDGPVDAPAGRRKAKAKPKKPASDSGLLAGNAPAARTAEQQFASARLAVEDLIATFGDRYAKGPGYLRRLGELEKAHAAAGTDAEKAARLAEFETLRREALLANPLLDFDRLLVLKRDFGGAARKVMSAELGTPKLNSHCNSAISHPESGWDNELAVVSDLRGAGGLQTVYKPPAGRIVVDPDLHFGAGRVLFSMIADHGEWGVFEVGIDPAAGRQSSPARLLTPPLKDVEHFDACYGPGGRIYFTSNAAMQGLPCERGKRPVVQMYSMDLATRQIRQVTFEQDSDWCPTPMPDGRILYLRWEYTDAPHYFTRLLMTMHPDGTGQMEFYGSNSYWPNAVFNARPVPDEPTRVIGIVGGHHGISRSGRLVILDTAKGRFEADGVVQEIPHRGRAVEPIIRDSLVNGVWPQFIYPYPLSASYHLVSMKRDPGALWGVYLVDVFDNVTLLKEVEGSALLEAQPLTPRPEPAVIPPRADASRKDALVYLVDIHRGAGLAGIPRGTVKKLRLFAYHYGYNNSANHDFVGIESSWDVKRILGTVPVEADGSAYFRIPASMPISLQPLDEEGRALQLMRSWLVGMPGETVSCVGCHEQQSAAPPNRLTAALARGPSEIAPWYGRARGFGFRREVQPVLDKFCSPCHDGTREELPNFTDPGGAGFSRSYQALQLYVRRPGPEGDYHLTTPMEYHADTSEVIQMLRKGHENVQLDEEAWGRLYAWIDLNAPYYGTWSEREPLQEFRGVEQRQRRRELARLYAGIDTDPEADADLPRVRPKPVIPQPGVPWLPRQVRAAGWPFDAAEARRRQNAAGPATTRTIDLGDGATMELVLIPAGEFVIGDADNDADERPMERVRIGRAFWMSATEVTNGQYHRFDPAHESKYIDLAAKDQSTRGHVANRPAQPVIRVSWREAMAFCRWLGERTGQPVTLPTEAQWEYACRAGTDTPLYYGDEEADFSKHANLADRTALNARPKGKRGGITPFPAEGQFDDGQLVSCDVGQYAPNAWGLRDLHGNVAEWTRSLYRLYPYDDGDGRNRPGAPGKRVVRGGSWHDRPIRCRSAFRLAYEPYQKVFHVGFRIVMAAE